LCRNVQIYNKPVYKTENMSQTPIQQAQQVFQTVQQTTTVPQQVQPVQQPIQQTTEQHVNRMVNLIVTMLNIANEIAIEMAMLEEEKCINCNIVKKCKSLIKILREIIELQKTSR